MNFLPTALRAARRIAKRLYLRILFFTGLLRWARLSAAKRGVVVITLHQVLSDAQYDSGESLPGMAVRASTFRCLLEYMTRHCQCILPGEALADCDRRSTWRRPQVVFTFDDGWKDNFEIAFPMCRQYGVPFTVFICPENTSHQSAFWTSRVNRLWWAAQHSGKLHLLGASSRGSALDSPGLLVDHFKHVEADQRERCITKLQAILGMEEKAKESDHLLTWTEIKKMASAGVAFGSHTNNHSVLTDISSGDVVQQLTQSKKAIETELGSCCWFAYPNGDWSDSVRDLVARAGYQLAFANSPGIWKDQSHPLTIPRVNVWEGSLIGSNGRLSRIALEYSIFWKAYRARPESGHATNSPLGLRIWAPRSRTSAA